jgi:predicted DNA-binding antitoxin AbrB/MazE fold protein
MIEQGGKEFGSIDMFQEIEATYENGTLILDQPLALQEHERVVVGIKPRRSPIRQSAGPLKWMGIPPYCGR